MANLKEIRVRINSVSSTKQITSAMKLVSAAKLRKAQDAITKMRPYADKLSELISDVSSNVELKDENIYTSKRDVEKVLLIAVSSNRGLCGAFNANIIKKIIELTQTKYKKNLENKNVSLFIIGKKAEDILKSKGYKNNIIGTKHEIFDDLNFENIIPTAEFLMQEFANENYDKIDIVYNSFKNTATQDLKNEQLLPISLKNEEKHQNKDYIFEPNQEFILDVLIPKSIKIQIYKALLDSIASEHGARMTAMHKATDNATELIKDLRLSYNKARQASITNEIIEIVGGAESLNN